MVSGGPLFWENGDGDDDDKRAFPAIVIREHIHSGREGKGQLGTREKEGQGTL